MIKYPILITEDQRAIIWLALNRMIPAAQYNATGTRQRKRPEAFERAESLRDKFGTQLKVNSFSELAVGSPRTGERFHDFTVE